MKCYGFKPGLKIFLVFLFFGGSGFAQIIPKPGSETISELLEESFSNNEEEVNPEYLADELYPFLDRPLNLNTAEADDLRQLHMLTEFQIYSFLQYRREEGLLLSIYELQLITGFDRNLIEKLIPFVCINQVSENSNPQKNKNHLRQLFIARLGSDVEKKAGFIADSTGRTLFAGSNRILRTRYEASLSDFSFSLVSDQDAGESFQSGGKFFCPDYMSAALEYKGSKAIKKIIVGDYKAGWGQGLILGGFGKRKGLPVLISPETNRIKKNSSGDENNFFRGAAISFEKNKMELSLIASRHHIDANIHNSADSASDKWFSAPDESGLHRSTAELNKKDALLLNVLGAHAEYKTQVASFGISYLNSKYDASWVRNSTAYTQEYFPAGEVIQNFGSDFRASMGKIAVFGEAAADCKGRLALFASALAELSPLFRLSLTYRYYQPDYLASMASGFGENQGTKNEEGFYLGLEMYPWKYLKAELYADTYSFPFLRYNSTNPYSGTDYFMNFEIYPSRDFTCTLRFKFEQSQNRSDKCRTGIDLMDTTEKGNFRLSLVFKPYEKIEIKSRLEISSYKEAKEAVSRGYYSGHDIGCRDISGRYSLWIRYAIYDIPRWENRIYAYENDVLYSFSVPAFSSKGTRFVILGKAEIIRGVEVSARYALSQFGTKKERGTGGDYLIGDSDSFLTFQIKIRM